MKECSLKKCSICHKDLPPEAYYTSVNYGWCKECHIKRAFAFRRTPIGKLTEMKKDAKKRGIPFLLSLKDVEEMWEDPCAYCGRKVQILSLDRKDNTKPYDVNNVAVCCRWCNYAKGTGSLAFFYNQCKLVAENMPSEFRHLGDVKDGGARYTNSWCKKKRGKQKPNVLRIHGTL